MLSRFPLYLIALWASQAAAFSFKPFEYTMGLGGTFLKSGNSVFQVTDTETDNALEKSVGKSVDFNLGLAYPIPLQTTSVFPSFKLAANLRYFNTQEFGKNIRGDIEQYQNIPMDNYEYQLAVSSTRLMFDGILTIVQVQPVSLFVTAGIGPGWTRVSYHDSPKANIMGGGLNLKPSVKTGFVAEGGAGVNYNYTEHVRLSIEYLYTHFGHISPESTGVLDGLPIIINPPRFTLHSQAVLFGFHLTIG